MTLNCAATCSSQHHTNYMLKLIHRLVFSQSLHKSKENSKRNAFLPESRAQPCALDVKAHVMLFSFHYFPVKISIISARFDISANFMADVVPASGLAPFFNNNSTISVWPCNVASPRAVRPSASKKSISSTG